MPKVLTVLEEFAPSLTLKPEGPFFNSQKAAAYCDYAVGTFERILRDYDIPKFGPKKNRFAKSVLDAWMDTPDAFKKNSRPKPRRRTPKPVII